MSNKLRIDIYTAATEVYGTTVYFDENEVMDCKVTNNAKCEILESFVQLPNVFDGSQYEKPSLNNTTKIIAINILHFYSTTKAKLETLFSYKNKMWVYYKYADNSLALLTCVLDPVYSERYAMGQAEAKYITKLTFYETNQIGGISFIPEVIIDPDGKNIKLDGKKDIISISYIVQSIDIEPSRSGIIENNDIQITINNQDNYTRAFNNVGLSTDFNPFRSICDCIQSVSGNVVTLQTVTWKTGLIKFKMGDIVTLTNGTNTEERIITAIGETIVGDQVIPTLTLNIDPVYAYTSGDMIRTWSFVGRDVIVKLRIENEYQLDTKTITTYTVYKGKIRETPQTDGNKAVFTIEPFSNEIFSAPLDIKSTALISSAQYEYDASGTGYSTFSWTVKTGSGVFDDGELLLGTIAHPGKWTVTFSDATNFTVTGPNCSAKAGTTGTDFYDQTDASDSQIKLDKDGWSGTPASGDILEFYLSVVYFDLSINQIIYDLLVNNYGLSASDIDSTTIFNTGGGNYRIAFSEGMTIGDTISIVLQGSRMYLTTTYDGIFKLAKLENFNYYINSSVYTTLDSSSISEADIFNNNKIGILDIYNEVIINYAYDYANEMYACTYKYPLLDTTNKSYLLYGKKRTLILDVPGIYSKTVIATMAEDLYKFYAYGIINVESDLALTKVNIITPGYMYSLPSMTDSLSHYCISKEIDFNNNKIISRGINLNKFPATS